MGQPKKSRFARVAEPLEPRRLFSTYVVNTLSDAVNPVAGKLTLRQAVADANANAGADTIAFDPKVFASGSQHTITLTQGQILLTDATGATTITGPGANVAAISGNGKSRIFDIGPDVTVSISGLTLTHGKSTAADSIGNTYGGAIVNGGTLTITGSMLSGNTVDAQTYSYDQNANHTPGNGQGGAIYSIGILTVTSSTLTGNLVINEVQSNEQFADAGHGESEGGAIYASGILTVTSDLMSNNLATGFSRTSATGVKYPDAGFGGGIYTAGATTITSSTITGNTAYGGIGDPKYGDGGNAYGGGIYAKSSLSITGSIVTKNDTIANRPGPMGSYAGHALGGGIDVRGDLTIDASTIVSNQAIGSATGRSSVPTAGGGIYAASSATMAFDTISNNQIKGGPSYEDGVSGGGVIISGSLVLMSCTVSGNTITIAGAHGQGEGVGGGGIEADDGATVTDSTISGNIAHAGRGENGNTYNMGGYYGGFAAGGGLGVDLPSTLASLTITNTTIANNRAIGGKGGNGGRGGGDADGGGINVVGINVKGTGTVIISNSTITGNSVKGGEVGSTNGRPPGSDGLAYAAGISGALYQPETATLNNSIISGNKAKGVFSDVISNDHSKYIGITTVGANNLIGVGSDLVDGVNGNIVGVSNPQLSPLGNYGGPTQTMPPLFGSLAINGGSNSALPKGDTTDQRGDPRIAGGAVDIGAVELPSGSISGITYNDANGDGKHESNEPGLNGWGCFIDANHNGVYDTGERRAFTDSNGDFTFPDLAPGTYTLVQLPPVGWHQTQTSLSRRVTVKSGQNITGINFGNRYVGTGTVSGIVFNDTDASGIFESDGYLGIVDGTVYADLYNLGRLVDGDPTATTDDLGDFTLTGITAGKELIRQVQPTGWLQSVPAKQAGIAVNIPANATVTGMVFGSTQAIHIAGTVFNDTNGNAKQDTGETGLGGWTVDAVLNNAIVEQATTDSTGAFSFQDLKAGTYTIRVVVKSGYKQTVPVPNSGETVTLASGGVNTAVIFGEQKIA
jgi:uncharacterized protein (DUF2141 family)